MQPLALSLDDLQDSARLRALVAAPESDWVERKREVERDTLTKAISGFANADGGWLLLGVEDDGTLTGFRPPGEAHLRDWVRDRLDTRLDPTPPFVADLLYVEGVPIGVIRVPRSTRTPHFIDRTGEVYERRNGQTRRVDGFRVRELYQRGPEARQQAINRLDDAKEAPAVRHALGVPAASGSADPDDLAVVVRLSLEETPQTYRAWVDRPEAMRGSETFVGRAVDGLNDRDYGAGFMPWKEQPSVARELTGHVARAGWDGFRLTRFAVAFDAAGVAGFGVQGSKRGDIFTFLDFELRDRWLGAGLPYLVDALHRAGVLGPAVARLDVYGVAGCRVSRRSGPSGHIDKRYGNHVQVDVDVDLARDDAAVIGERLWSQLERLAGAMEYP